MFTVGAGRTDAGVHALGQVMTTSDAPEDVDLVKVRDAVNAICGPPIAVWSATEAPADFHARFSARSRTYVYAIYQADVLDPFLAPTALHHPTNLDLDAMNEAAGHLVGHHDFSSFGRVDEGQTSERTLFELNCSRSGPVVRVTVRANAFIQQMVRSLVGTLILVGEGRRDPGEMSDVLSARDRATAGPVAPPHGLCLVSVEYEQGFTLPSSRTHGSER